jgi:hypothetical protein
VPLPGIRFVEFINPDELERRKDEVSGNIVRVHAPVEDAKPLLARLAGLGAHDAQIVPLPRDVQALEVAPGSVTTLRQAVLARAARVGPGLSPARAAAIGLEILATCSEE